MSGATHGVFDPIGCPHGHHRSTTLSDGTTIYSCADCNVPLVRVRGRLVPFHHPLSSHLVAPCAHRPERDVVECGKSWSDPVHLSSHPYEAVCWPDRSRQIDARPRRSSLIPRIPTPRIALWIERGLVSLVSRLRFSRMRYFQVQQHDWQHSPVCPECHLERTPDGHDPCVAGLPGVRSACCGHGIRCGYIVFDDGRTLKIDLLGWEQLAL